MSWNTLTVNAYHNVNGVTYPYSDLDVTFVMVDNTNQVYYSFDKKTNSLGVATLNGSNTIVSERESAIEETVSDRSSTTNNDSKEQSRTTMNQTTTTGVTNWYVKAVINDTVVTSETYDISTTAGTLTFIDNGKGEQSMSENKLIIRAMYRPDGYSYDVQIEKDAVVYVWFYTDNWEYYGKPCSAKTGDNSTNMGGCVGISIPQGNYTQYKVNAYYHNTTNGKYYEYLSQTIYSVDYEEVPNVYNRQLVLDANAGNGYYYSINSVTNYDSLFYYIGKQVLAMPVKVVFKDEQGTALYTNSNVTTSTTINKTGYCSSQYLSIYVTPTGATSSYYDESVINYNIFGYIGGLIGKSTTRTPRKNYTVEMPVVYDTRTFSVLGEVPCYNLPNTNIKINFNAYGISYSKDMTSNVSAVSFLNSEITSNSINKDYFYKGLAGKTTEKLRFNLTKHHYDNTNYTNLALSSRTSVNGTQYTYTSSTIDYLYFCPKDELQNPTSQQFYAFTLPREKEVVFRRKEVADYVKGFGYGRSNGNDNPTPGHEEEQSVGGDDRGETIDYSSFSLSNTAKCPPSKSAFYSEATNGLPGATTANNLTDFKTNFIDVLRNVPFTTVYTNPSNVESNQYYGNNSNHCYVMDRTITPSETSVPDYLYFYNENSFYGYTETELKTKLCEYIINNNPELYNTGNTTTASPVVINAYQAIMDGISDDWEICLDMVGKPSGVNLEYSYNNLQWKPYYIGQKIRLGEGTHVRFRAEINGNQTFSNDFDNYYTFKTTNPTQLEINMFKASFNFEPFEKELRVGGRISSLLVNTPDSNASLNNCGFYRLFSGTQITTNKQKDPDVFTHLKLDLLTIPSSGYYQMFADTVLLKDGADIYATDVYNCAMEEMYINSTLDHLYEPELKFDDARNRCCYRMFENSYFNGHLKIDATSARTSAFEEMFYNTKKISKVTTFLTKRFEIYAAKNMFAESNISKFPSFPIIEWIGMEGFSHAFYRTKLYGALNFKITNSVGLRGCEYMCADSQTENNLSISTMQLNATSLYDKCYSFMFWNSPNVIGTFTFTSPTYIPTSGCCYMFYNTGKIDCNILPALDLTEFCYAFMFCKSKMETAPELPATTLFESCYESMFDSSEVSLHHNMYIPTFANLYRPTSYVLQATVLPRRCYYRMYADSKLKYVSSMIAEKLTTAGEQSCGYMFSNTPIFIENRKRKIVRDDGLPITFRFYQYRAWQYAHCALTYGNSSNEDMVYHVGQDIYMDNEELYLLTGATGTIRDDVWVYVINFESGGTPHWNYTATTEGYGISEGTEMTFIDKRSCQLVCEINQSQIGAGGSRSMEIAGKTFVFNVQAGTYMNDVEADSFGTYKGYYTRHYSPKISIVVNDAAYYMQEVYDSLNIQRVTINGVEYVPFVWLAYAWPGKKVFSSDRRSFLKIGKYAKYSYQEDSVVYTLSATYDTQIGNYVCTNEHTFNYVAASELVNLNATSLSQRCYEHMFSGCTNLYYGHNFKFGSLTTLASRCFSHMFDSCSNLRTMTSDINKFTTPAEYCCEYMYANCSTSEYWKNKYFIFYQWDWHNSKGFVDAGLDRICNINSIYTKYDGRQNYCDPLDGGPYEYGDEISGEHAFSSQIDSIECDYIPNVDYPYWNAGGLYTLDDDTTWESYDFNKPLATGCYQYMFENCNALRRAKLNLTKVDLPDYCYKGMFRSCENLKYGITISNSLNSVSKQSTHSMFEGCTYFVGPINSSHKLNAMSLGEACYASMFAGCGSMSAAPYLPATTMVTSCYNNMFNSATIFKIRMEVYAECDLVRKDGQDTLPNRTFYLVVSGTNKAVKFYYWKKTASIGEWLIVDNNESTDESDFEITFNNNIPSLAHMWFNPDTLYFYDNFSEVEASLLNKLRDILYHHWVYDTTGSSNKKWYYVNSFENQTVNSHIKTITDNVEYIRAKISKSDLESGSYTYNWVSKLDEGDGDYYGPNASSTSYGSSRIPNGWGRHNI